MLSKLKSYLDKTAWAPPQKETNFGQIEQTKVYP